MDIEDWRNEIDRIDESLVELLNRRAQCAMEIGRLKRERGLPVYSPEREREVAEHVVAANAGPLQAEAIRSLFERIVDESRSLERATVERENAEKAKPKGVSDSEKPGKRKVRGRA